MVEAVAGAPVELRVVPPGEDRPDKGGLALLAQILIGGKPAGVLGQLAPSRAKELELRGDVLVAELRIAALRELAASGAESRAFMPLARFPSVTRDLAVVADRALAHGEISAALLGAGEELLAGVELFDVFTDARGRKDRRRQKVARLFVDIPRRKPHSQDRRSQRGPRPFEGRAGGGISRRPVPGIMNVRGRWDGRNERTVLLQQRRNFSVGAGVPARKLFTLRCSR